MTSDAIQNYDNNHKKIVHHVQSGFGASSILDAEIVRHLGLQNTCPFWLHTYNGTTPMRLSVSIDHTKKLANTVLPSYSCTIAMTEELCEVTISFKFDDKICVVSSSHIDEARARLLAVLKACNLMQIGKTV